ncbi:MAG: hypothetical protein RIR28_1240 [Pseudomonadota bacterium]
MTHLVELRDRLIKAALSVLVVFLGLVYWAPQIYTVFAEPLIATLPAGSSMIATDVTAPFFVPMKVTMLVAFVLALPYVLYQAWAFVAPGLYTHEKRLAMPIIVTSFLLFLVGMAFAYFFVFPAVFGSLQKMIDFRPYFIVAAFVVAAIVTPPDVISQLMLAIPLCLLYQLGIWLSGWVTPTDRTAAAQDSSS